MTHRFMLWAVLSVVLLCAQDCFAADDTLVFVAQEDYAPFQYYDNEGAAQGLDIEIIRKASELTGLGVSFTLVPWIRALNMARYGQAEGVFGCGKEPAREEFLYYPDTPVRYSEMVFFANDHFQGEINGLDDLGDLKVGCVVDYLISREFNENSSLNKDFTNSTESLFLKLAANRHPVAVYNKMAGWHTVRKLGLRNIRMLPYVIASYPAYLAFSKASPKGKLAFEKFSEALGRLHKDGFLEQMYEKYLR